MTLVFDFDGVLVESRDANIEAINAYADKYGFAPLDVDTYIAMLRENFAEYWRTLLGERMDAFMQDLHRHPRPHPPMVPGMVEIVRAYRPAIVSSNSASIIQSVLAKHDLHPPIYGIESDTSKVRKLARLQAIPDIFVTDTIGDVEEGKTAGYLVIAVTWGFTPAEDLRASEPHHLVHAPQELRDVLTALHTIAR